MTITTGLNNAEKKENIEGGKKDIDFVPVVVTEKTPAVPISRPSSAWSAPSAADIQAAEWYRNWRRRRMLTSLCLSLLVLWLMLAALMGGYLLFRHFHRRPAYYGWCGVRYTDKDGGGYPRYEKLQERVEVDQDLEYEKIEVPRFGPNRPAIFIHDFKQNLTGIADLVGDQCFISPLDRKRIAPPNSFEDLVKKMEEGYYEQNAGVVRERYQVRLPPLTPSQLWDLESTMIFQQCEDKVSFMMDRVTVGALERPHRSFNKLQTRKKREENCFQISHINTGDGSNYEVVNYEVCK